MKRGVWIGVLAVLAFAAVLVVRLPAKWLAGALPPDIACSEIRGTLWNGACDALTLRNTPLGDLQWRLHPQGLMHGTLASWVALDGPAGTAAAEIEARTGGQLEARDLRANFNLDPARLPQLPPAVRGKVQADLSRLRVRKQRIVDLAGQIHVRDLEQRNSEPRRLGDYILTFPAANAPQRAGEPVGEVRSTAGPFAVEGTLRLTGEPGFVLDGLIAARPDAPAEVARQLRYLGTADARGRRPFSIAGTF